MIHNTLANVQLTENHVYRFGGLLLEATYRRGWTLIVLTEQGHHAPRKHGALVAFKMRDDGLWDTVYDHATRRFLGWKKWSVIRGKPRAISVSQLEHIAESRYMVEMELQEIDVERRFREIMATMEW
jgi:hypothetical protein